VQYKTLVEIILICFDKILDNRGFSYCTDNIILSHTVY
jgi:hypothetical protein